MIQLDFRSLLVFLGIRFSPKNSDSCDSVTPIKSIKFLHEIRINELVGIFAVITWFFYIRHVTTRWEAMTPELREVPPTELSFPLPLLKVLNICNTAADT